MIETRPAEASGADVWTNNPMCESASWSPPPKVLSLNRSEIHVWRITLDQSVQQEQKLLNTLARDERERADRFAFLKDRRHYIVARGFLRFLLGNYLDAKAEQLEFSYGAYGKPAVAGKHRTSGLHFNLSHSHGVAVYALAYDREIGIDVERVRADFASAEIARRFFSRLEVESFLALRSEEQLSAFFRCWTRKEAYIKATGRGLSQPLDEFDVTLAPGVPAALLRTEADERPSSSWVLSDLQVGSDYAAALAVEGPVSELHCWQGLAFNDQEAF